MLTNVTGDPALLFGYFAILNAAILALAWVRSWRALNLLGFVFTFVLGSIWAYRYYRPLVFRDGRAFPGSVFRLLRRDRDPVRASRPLRGTRSGRRPAGLRRAAGRLRAPGRARARHRVRRSVERADARDRLRLAFSVAARAHRGGPGVARARVPRAGRDLRDDRRSAGVRLSRYRRAVVGRSRGAFWLGVRQSTPLLRGFALLVEFGAGAVFLWSGAARGGDPLFANAFFVGAILVAVSGIVTAAVADRAGDKLPAPERGFVPLLLLWGAAWWLVGGAFELKRHLDRIDTPHAALAWVVVSVAAALLVARRFAGRASRWSASRCCRRWRSRLGAIGRSRARRWRTSAAVLWPLAWVVQWSALYAADAPQRDRHVRPVGAAPHARPAVRRACDFGDRADRAGRLGSERVGRPHRAARNGLACLRRGVAAGRLPVPGAACSRTLRAGR